MKPGAFARVIPFTWVSLACMAAAPAHAGGDAGRGADLFQLNCAACHSVERGQNRVGPSLFSVVGRPAASLADYTYSDAMTHSGVLWTTDKLMTYLKAPRRFIPGVKMMFPGLAPEQDREDVIAYLATMRDAAPASVSTADPALTRRAGASN